MELSFEICIFWYSKILCFNLYYNFDLRIAWHVPLLYSIVELAGADEKNSEEPARVPDLAINVFVPKIEEKV